jgi:type IV secretory pathway ATPase VirB11/archaellum biosynthesis ATPase
LVRLFGRKKDPTKPAGDAKVANIRYPPVGAPVPPSWREVERYALNAPFAYAVIAEDPSTSTKKYFLDEVSLTPREGQIYTYILDTLESELTVPRGEIDPKSYFRDQAKRIVMKYGIKASQLAWPKILYFAERDLVGFGILDGLMRDVNIEDISADGLKKPIFVYQRQYESIETNISFTEDLPLDNLISRLAHMAGKHISTAFPIVQGTLPGRHRLSATFRREVSPYGGTFCMKSGRVQLANGLVPDIKDLFEEARRKWGSRVEAGNEVVDVGGRLSVIGANEKTLALSESGVRQILKLAPPESLVKVWIEEGERNSEPFEVTLNHKFHVLARDGLQLVEAAELRPGSWIPVPTRIPSERMRLSDEDFRDMALASLRDSGPKLLVSMEGEALELARKAVEALGGVHRAEKALNLRYGYLFDALVRGSRRQGAGSMRLARYLGLLSAAGLEPPRGELFLRKAGVRVRIPLRLTGDLAFIAGWVLAGGLLNAGSVTVTPSGPAHRDEIAGAFRRVFGSDHRLYEPPAGRSGMKFASSAVADYLSRVFEVPDAPKARSTRVPRAIMKSDDRVVSAFLRGVFQGDGTYAKTGSASLKGSSKPFLKDIQFLLTRFGVFSFIAPGNRLGIPASYQEAFFDDVMGVDRGAEQAAGLVREIAPVPVVGSLGTGAGSPEPLEAPRRDWGAGLKSTGSPYRHEQSAAPGRASRAARAVGVDADRGWFSALVGEGYDFRRISRVEVAANAEPVYDVVCEPDHFYVGGAVPMIVYDTIRKFREDPVTITDLINMNVIDQNIAAYVWLLMENRATALVAGATGSGKTTLMNALLTFTRMNSKIVTIEEVQEANLPHSNWTALLSRESYGVVEDSGREIGLFDLVKTAMRMRPDILVVGEVRGEEAYVLFQAISTGHGGISTVHADDVGSAIQRLTSKPMDVPAAFIPFLDLVFTVRRIAIPTPDGGFRNVRRVLSVDEVVSVDNYVKMFKWDPVSDKHVATSFKNSVKLAKLARDLGLTQAELADELGRRATVLKWVQQKGVRNFRELSAIFEDYRSNPRGVAERAYKEQGLIRVATEGEA